MGNGQSGSGFTWSTTGEQAARNVDLKGKNIIVTGGNTGMILITYEEAHILNTFCRYWF